MHRNYIVYSRVEWGDSLRRRAKAGRSVLGVEIEVVLTAPETRLAHRIIGFVGVAGLVPVSKTEGAQCMQTPSRYGIPWKCSN